MRRLIYNPNALHAHTVKEQIKNSNGTQYELLQRIVGKELAKAIEDYEQPAPIPSAVVHKDLPSGLVACGTVIYVWGVRECGKTGVVGSLLALPEVEISQSQKFGDMCNRAKALAEAYEPDENTYRPLPVTEEPVNSKVTFATIRHRSGSVKRKYKVAFVEAELTNHLPTRLLDAPTEQIHIFCVDITEPLDIQANLITHKLKELEAEKYIQNQTACVYVLATKVDTMYRVPVDYRVRAAQTMITIRCRSLWQKIRNICYSKGIYGATPIAFSVGDVKLKELARLSDSYSHRLLLSHIIPKCRPERTLLEQLMRVGGKRSTAAMVILFIGAMVYGLSCFFHIDGAAPEEGNMVYKFIPDFKTRVGVMAKAKDFSSVQKLYEELHDDLYTEHDIYFYTSQGQQRLIPTDSFKVCRQQLDSTMAAMVSDKVERELASSSWNANLLKSCVGYADRLKDKDYLKRKVRQNLTTYSDQIHTYFEILRLANNPACTSVDDVKAKVSRMQSYNKLPYTNCHDVSNKMSEFPAHAIDDCARNFAAEASRLSKERDSLKDRSYTEQIYDYFSNSSRSQRNSEAISRLRMNLKALKELAHIYNVTSSDSAIDSALSQL